MVYSITAATRAPVAERQTISMLRVLLDARKIGDGGIGTYLSNLIHGLSSEPGILLSVICSRGREGLLPKVGGLEIIHDSAEPYSLDEYFGLARRIDQRNFDLVHFPHFTLPFGFKIPSVITVHDLIHVRAPQRRFYPLIAKPLIASSLQRASKVIAVSEATRKDILSLTGGSERINSKLSVVPNAVDSGFTALPISGASSCRLVEDPYIVGVFSNNKPHKGLAQLLKAFSEFKGNSGRIAESSVGSKLKLVLVGRGALEARPVHADVVCCGEVSNEDLHTLYQDSLGVIVASRMEGFCLPVIEAHASGVPVISTPVPAILELLEPEDIVCVDFEASALLEGLRRFVDQLELRGGQPRRVDPTKTLQKFSRASVIEKLTSVYKGAIEAN